MGQESIAVKTYQEEDDLLSLDGDDINDAALIT